MRILCQVIIEHLEHMMAVLSTAAGGFRLTSISSPCYYGGVHIDENESADSTASGSGYAKKYCKASCGRN
jgi:hypothetical protein